MAQIDSERSKQMIIIAVLAVVFLLVTTVYAAVVSFVKK